MIQLVQKIKKLQKGLTIVEMLMYMAIFAILMTVLTQIFTTSLNVQLESKSTSSVQQDGTYILSRMSYDIKRAQSIVVPQTYGQATGTLQLVINGSTYTYSTDLNNNFTLTNNQGTSFLNSAESTITNLTFTRIGNPGGKSTIVMSFQVNSTTQQVSGLQRKVFSTTISLR